MAIIKPFKALRPKPAIAKQVASRPYDVLSSEEARTEAKDNPVSFLHVTKAEIDFPPSVDSHSAEVYAQAKKNLDHFIDDGTLFSEEIPCYYIYRLTWKGKSQTGLVCVSSVADYFNDVIKKHELTRPEKEKDRIDHMVATRAQTGNVFLAYRDVDEVNDVIDQWKNSQKAVYDFLADDEVRHELWIINEPATVDLISRLFHEKVPSTYIADGHHRAASAARVNGLLKQSPDADYFLTTIFPASELAILDYNRVLKDLNHLTTEEFLGKLEADFSVQKAETAVSPRQIHEFGLYLDRQWYRLKAKKGSFTNDPIGVLDITILSNNILDKILGIKDQRTDQRIDFVGGIRGLAELEKRVDQGDMKMAFSLYPVSISQLFAIADSGQVMPPKSTWFEPKLRDGLLTHVLG